MWLYKTLSLCNNTSETLTYMSLKGQGIGMIVELVDRLKNIPAENASLNLLFYSLSFFKKVIAAA